VYSADPAGLVRTVLGDVTPDTLGAMLIHEHLLTAPPAFALHEDPDLEFGTPDGAAAEVADLVEAGGGGLVELTTADYGRDVTAALAAARATGARIVQGTGLQKGIYYPAGTTRRSSEELAADFVRDIREGFGPEHTRAGAIKAGTCSTEELWDVERTVLRAAALAAKETGAPILTHTQAGRLGHDQLDVFESAGLDLSQVCVGHLDRNLEEDYLVSLARRGVWLGLDQWTKDKYGHDTDRAAMVRRLVDAGHTKVMVSGDLGRGSYQRAYGGSPGLGACLTAIRKALGDELAELTLVANPAAFLAFREAGR
jgi:predicted metal-dependent phosphotriesterase family hydrolase